MAPKKKGKENIKNANESILDKSKAFDYSFLDDSESDSDIGELKQASEPKATPISTGSKARQVITLSSSPIEILEPLHESVLQELDNFPRKRIVSPFKKPLKKESPGISVVRKVRTVQESPVTDSSPMAFPSTKNYSNMNRDVIILDDSPCFSGISNGSNGPRSPVKRIKIPLKSETLKEDSDSDCEVIDLTILQGKQESSPMKATIGSPSKPVKKEVKSESWETVSSLGKKIKNESTPGKNRLELPIRNSPKTARSEESLISRVLNRKHKHGDTPGKSHMSQSTNPLTSASRDHAMQQDSDDEDDRWLAGLQEWSTNVALSKQLEEQVAAKVIEMIPLDETLEEELEKIRQVLIKENGGNGTPKALNIQLLEHQILGLCWMMRMEESKIKGGILADDMGMGKTIQTLALIHQNRVYPSARQAGTLIVAPVALIYQWEREIISKSNTRLKVYVHHGHKRHQLKDQLRQYDVVITTYNIVSMESPRPAQEIGDSVVPGYGGGPLFKANFQRIVLDESQIIKNHRTTASLACANFMANTRFSLSGTPIQNSIEDIFSQFRFLDVPVWGEWEIFYKEISSLIKKDRLSDCKLAIHKVQAVLRGILLRRTKTSLDSNGKPILQLPEKTIELVKVELSTVEMEFYRSIESKATGEFDRILDGEGNALQVANLYSCFLVLLLRMRQACTHPHLITPLFDMAKKGQFNLNFMNTRNLVNNAPNVAIVVSPEGSRKARKVLSGPVHHRLTHAALQGQLLGQECPLCMDVMQSEVFTKCGHLYCKDCIESFLQRNATVDAEETSCPCPICRQPVKITELYPGSWFNTNAPADPDPMQLFKKNDGTGTLRELKEILFAMHPSGDFTEWIPSSKIHKMIEILKEIRKRDKYSKTVIFSQWTTLLNILGPALELHRFQYVRYDGAMSATERVEAIDTFTQDKSKTVALISLKAGGVGLNLTCATQVILMDLWWNPKVEDQAIDRVHRIGQVHPVTIYRMSVSETVEDRILVLQDQKRRLADSALGEDDELRIPKLTMQDLRFLFRGGSRQE